MKRKFMPEQEAEIVRRYEAGESSEDIAKTIFAGRLTSGVNVRNVLKRLNVSLRPAAHTLNPLVTDDQKARAVELCRGGCTLRQAADLIGISKKTVFKATKAAGLSLPIGKPKHREESDMSRPKRIFTPEQKSEIVRLYVTDKESISSIADVLGATRPVVSRILAEQGVEIRQYQQALTPMQREEAIRRFEAGESYLSMERLFGVDRKTISATVRRNGGTLRSRGRQRHYESRKEWLQDPKIRMRKLLLGARSNGREYVFEEALFDILPNNPPKNCTACGILLDYNVYVQNDPARSRNPSLDRCENNIGYVVGNVYVVCLRCNRLKNSASFEELKALVDYVEKHRKNRRGE